MSDEDRVAGEAALRAILQTPAHRASRRFIQDLIYSSLAYLLTRKAPESCTELLEITDRLTSNHGGHDPLAADDQVIALIAANACYDTGRRVAALTALVQHYPDRLEGFEDHAILGAALYLDDPAVLRFFVDGSWRPQDEVTDLSRLRLQLARAPPTRRSSTSSPF